MRRIVVTTAHVVLGFIRRPWIALGARVRPLVPVGIKGFGVALAMMGASCVMAEVSDPLSGWVADVDQHWSSQRYRERSEHVKAFPIPLGAMKKIRGSWRLESYHSVTGTLHRYTWQIDGLPVSDLFDEIHTTIEAAGLRQRWLCAGRACGNGAEWASRVYQERLLYGRDEAMRYVGFEAANGSWLTVFSAARTANRQYLHIDIAVPDTAIKP